MATELLAYYGGVVTKGCGAIGRFSVCRSRRLFQGESTYLFGRFSQAAITLFSRCSYPDAAHEVGSSEKGGEATPLTSSARMSGAGEWVIDGATSAYLGGRAEASVSTPFSASLPLRVLWGS